jgi:hypothetical protein
MSSSRAKGLMTYHKNHQRTCQLCLICLLHTTPTHVHHTTVIREIPFCLFIYLFLYLELWNPEIHQAAHYILTIKPTRCSNFSNLFWNKTLHGSDSTSVHHQEFFTVHTAMVYVIQVCWQLASRIRTELSKTRTVLFQNKFEKLMHLVGSIIRIYQDARSSECQNGPTIYQSGINQQHSALIQEVRHLIIGALLVVYRPTPCYASCGEKMM